MIKESVDIKKINNSSIPEIKRDFSNNYYVFKKAIEDEVEKAHENKFDEIVTGVMNSVLPIKIIPTNAQVIKKSMPIKELSF